MAEIVQHTWQLLLPTHGNQLLSASELAAHSNGRYSPTYMATTVPTHGNQYTLASKLVF